MACDGAMKIGNLVHIAETLENIMSPCFGPLGGQVLFTSATGEILITRDGCCILESLLLDHPAARLMARSALAHGRRTGDGAKSFVLLLAALLRGAQAAGGDGRLQLCRGLARLERALPQQLAPHCASALGPGPDLQPGAAARVLAAHLRGQVGAAEAGHLGRLACELLWQLAGGKLGPALRLLADCLSGLQLVVPGLPVSSSRVLEGLPLCRGLAVGSSKGPTGALLLSESLLPPLTRPCLTLGLGPASSLAQARARAQASLDQALSRLRGLGVGLLLSGPLQPAEAVQAVAQHGLALAHGLAAEELALVRRLMDAAPLSRLEVARPCDVLPVRFLRPLGLGPGSQVLVGFAARLRPHCLVLCAPAPSLARQHRHAIAAGYRLLRLLLPEEGTEGPGATGRGIEGSDPGSPEWSRPDPGWGSEGPGPGTPAWEGQAPGRGNEEPDLGPMGRHRTEPGRGSEGPDPGREGQNSGDPGKGSEGPEPGAPGREGPGTGNGREGHCAGAPGTERPDAGEPAMGREGQCAWDLDKAGQTDGTNGLSAAGTRSDTSWVLPSPLTAERWDHDPGPPHQPAGDELCECRPPAGDDLRKCRPPGGDDLRKCRPPAGDELRECRLPAGSVLPSGGTFEFLLHHHLRCDGASHQHPDTRLACRVLAEALLNIPRHLHRGSHAGRDFLRAHAHFTWQLQQGGAAPDDQGPLEVADAKLQLVISALHCLRSLLSVDRAIAVRGRLGDRAQSEESE